MKNEVNDVDDNKPFGIILCNDKEALTVKYELDGLLKQKNKKLLMIIL